MYADSAPETACLKLTKNGLECIFLANMSSAEKLKRKTGLGEYKLKSIEEYVNSKEFCTAVLTTPHENIEKLLAVANVFNFVNLKKVLCGRVERTALSAFEKHLVAKLNPGISPKEVRKAELDAIRLLDPKDAPHVHLAKITGLLTACKSKLTASKLEDLEKVYLEAEKLIPPLDAPNHRGIPDLAHIMLQRRLRDFAQEGLNEMFDQLLENPAAAKTLLKRTEQYVDSCRAHFEPHYQFYEKWGNCLDTEMIQGLLDPNEILDLGVCWSMALRWTVDEMNQQNLTTEITSQDRFDTARLEVMPGHHLSPDTEKMKKKHKISKTHTYNWGKDIQKDDLKKTLQQGLLRGGFSGVGQLAFWFKEQGHTISVCTRPGHCRVGDPSRGVFNLPNPEKTIEFLTDLMTTFYNKTFKSVRCYCYDL